MSVAPALSLAGRPAGRIRPALDGLARALAALDDPQRGLRSMLVVGTNGKGSTAAMAEAILRGHGLRTGLYTSPHLVRVEERVRLGGRAVEPAVLAAQLGRLDAFPDLTYFEALTAAAFAIFAAAGVEVAVLEAGMGGSWDATRLADSAIAGLTNVGTDHRAWLGEDRPAIARDKGRALAAASWAVLGPGVQADIVAELGAPSAVDAAGLARCTSLGGGTVRCGWGAVDTELRLPLAGSHQLDNLQLALALCVQAVAAGWLEALAPEVVAAAIAGLRWPGRLSRHRVAGREVLVDCAHNLEGAEALAAHLAGLDHRCNLLFSCLDDKPLEAMAAVLRPLVDRVAVCELADERAMPLARLQAAFPGARVAATPGAALALLPEPVLAAGSLRLAGALLAVEDGGAGW
ncbi:MAG: Mur ligase family protein [Thermoanaerobaculales bacterium]|nr:Mur ligase family protein [Thermoanaerobaculales bacterium]